LIRCSHPGKLSDDRPHGKTMERAALVLTLLLGATLSTQAAPTRGGHRPACVAKVLQSEQLPYAPVGYWRVRVALEVKPSGDPAYVLTRQDNMPIQQRPPRRGQTFRVRCDPANPTELHFIKY
jgi:hypothetical protein